MNKKAIIFIFLVIFTIDFDLFLYSYKKSKPIVSPIIVNSLPYDPVIPKNLSVKVEPEVSIKIEPQWYMEKPLRTVGGLGRVLGDIESHMPAGHIYKDSDKVTWGHETTHGINSRLRDKYKFKGHINCFYCLNNQVAVILEPNTKISRVANQVPSFLKNTITYKTYLIQQRRYWENEPLYICDEWVSYTNGSEVQHELNLENRKDTLNFMIHFDIYALALAKAIKEDDPNYDDSEFKKFLIWNLERSLNLIDNKNLFLKDFRTKNDAAKLREFTKSYLGDSWTMENFGF